MFYFDIGPLGIGFSYPYFMSPPPPPPIYGPGFFPYRPRPPRR